MWNCNGYSIKKMNRETFKPLDQKYGKSFISENSMMKLRNKKMRELDDMFGVLVHLTYYTNKLRLKAFDSRTGNSRMSDELSKFLR
jgi:hypothetical protein